MPLPDSGLITASMINEELGRAPDAPFSINGSEERALAGIESGPISFSDFYGKSSGSVHTVTFVVMDEYGYFGYLYNSDGTGGSAEPWEIEGFEENPVESLFLQLFYMPNTNESIFNVQGTHTAGTTIKIELEGNSVTGELQESLYGGELSWEGDTLNIEALSVDPDPVYRVVISII